MGPAPVRIRRDGHGRFTAVNARGAEVRIGRADAGADFSPVELLLAALGACAGLSAENVIARTLGEDAAVAIDVVGNKDNAADRLDGVRTSFELDLSGLDDAALATLSTKIARAVARACTVSRTVEPGVPVELAPLGEGRDRDLPA